MIYYIARCVDCDSLIPFSVRSDRDDWVAQHSKARDPFTDEPHENIQTWQERR